MPLGIATWGAYSGAKERLASAERAHGRIMHPVAVPATRTTRKASGDAKENIEEGCDMAMGCDTTRREVHRPNGQRGTPFPCAGRAAGLPGAGRNV